MIDKIKHFRKLKNLLFMSIILIVALYITSDSLSQFINVTAFAMIIIVVLEILSFVWKKLKPILPVKFVRVITAPYRIYVNFWRRALPDSVYKLWLQTGIMDEEAYRTWQERGFISDDLDPEYIMEEE